MDYLSIVYDRNINLKQIIPAYLLKKYLEGLIYQKVITF